MEAIEKRFEEFKNASYFSRLDKEHILDLRIGLDEKSRKSIELRCETFKARKVTSTNVIEVGQLKFQGYYSIRFSLCDDDMCGLFYKFCSDLLEETRNLKSVNEGYAAVVERYYQWRKMFVSSKKNLLSEPEIMGLIGEILLLKGHLANRIGLLNALKSWSGQELTHKDFSFDDTWIDSKAISRGSQCVKISSLEQLDSENDGELAVLSLEKMSASYNGVSLNKLVLETKELFNPGEEQDDFFAKVALQGYEYNTYYDDFVYEISSFKRFKVDSEFPKLTHKDLPTAIRKASYEISLVEIANFEIKEGGI